MEVLVHQTRDASRAIVTGYRDPCRDPCRDPVRDPVREIAQARKQMEVLVHQTRDASRAVAPTKHVKLIVQ